MALGVGSGENSSITNDYTYGTVITFKAFNLKLGAHGYNTEGKYDYDKGYYYPLDPIILYSKEMIDGVKKEL